MSAVDPRHAFNANHLKGRPWNSKLRVSRNGYGETSPPELSICFGL